MIEHRSFCTAVWVALALSTSNALADPALDALSKGVAANPIRNIEALTDFGCDNVREAIVGIAPIDREFEQDGRRYRVYRFSGLQVVNVVGELREVVVSTDIPATVMRQLNVIPGHLLKIDQFARNFGQPWAKNQVLGEPTPNVYAYSTEGSAMYVHYERGTRKVSKFEWSCYAG